MAEIIGLDWAINVFKIPKNAALRRMVKRMPWLGKILYRLPETMMLKLYRDDYTVTERVVEKGFVFMNLCGFVPGQKVLDVGCAWSSLPLELAGLGFKTWGLDIADCAFSHPNLISVRGTICSTGFEDDFFDVITAVSTVEHIGLGWYGDDVNEDSDLKAMREIRRILKPSGKLILTLPYGVKTTTKVFRVYDGTALAELIRGFEVINSAYFANSNDRYWYLTDEPSAARQGVNGRGRNEGNVCLALRKI